MKISFAITVHNEDDSLEKLLNQITEYKNSENNCEIIIVDDHSTNSETISVFNNFKEHIHQFQHSLDKNFGRHKNFLNSKCNGDYIFQIDADEYFSEDLLWNLKTLMESNKEVDLFMIPRVNTLEGMTQEHVMKWGWRVSALNDIGKPIINWPDYQFRFYRNSPNIKWERPLHELIVGADKVTYLPIEDATWALFHPKTIEQQEKQNLFYNTNFSKELNVRNG